VDDILRQGIQGIAEIINKTGVVNVDFADVKVIMQNSGPSIMGIGVGSGKDRANVAVEMAVKNPLLDVDISGARGILVNVCGGKDLSLSEYHKIVKYITDQAHPEANIIAGSLVDESLQDRVTVTLIATNFESMEKVPRQKKVEVEVETKTFPVRENAKPDHKAMKIEEKERNISKKPEKFMDFGSQNDIFNIGNDTFFEKEDIQQFLEEDTGFMDDLEVPAYLRKAK
jgi:cell division protein FtsZ